MKSRVNKTTIRENFHTAKYKYSTPQKSVESLKEMNVKSEIIRPQLSRNEGEMIIH